MATDQGKLSNVPGLAILAKLLDKSIPETGVTMFRPPWSPVALGAFAGHHRGADFRPARLTPTHALAEELGAVFVEAGPWLRAAYFPRTGETGWRESVDREVKAVRSSVGLIDVSTFGKIELQGPDVGKLLDRLYINTFSTLPVGKARYGVMLREDGFVMDDGTTAPVRRSLDHDHHHGQCREGQPASRILPARYVAGPRRAHGLGLRAMGADRHRRPARARPCREIVDDPAAISNASLPCHGRHRDECYRRREGAVFRLSFSGELGFEITVPADKGEALARELLRIGAEWDATFMASKRWRSCASRRATSRGRS